MARQRMVTRTIDSTLVTAKFLNDIADVVEVFEINLGCIEGMGKKALDAHIAKCTPDGYTFIKEVKRVVKSEIFGMTEQEFLKHAKIVER